MTGHARVLVATHLAALGLGWWIAPRQLLDHEAKHTGFFQVDASKVLSATVDSLHNENKLLVFSYKGTATVEAERSMFWVLGGRQQLIVPAVVPYYLDLSSLTLADVSYNEKQKIVTVTLPKPTIGDIAFQPESATTINGGILTWSNEQIDALAKLNYRSARRAMVMQAQSAGLLSAVRRQAQANVTSYFEIPLRIAGQPDVRVVSVFR
ncbi:DUF4230 domain-containing protein [Sphingomonas sp. AAP5]|uniref:DUF4230 domain-containing protein n=1 Tax=Sphingomonas sp. AAP5 TaxID=1523415 RepID=UPI00105745F0|nr:DUF4230 domain-containing protein [Sphingomonas sp. AAP5]QBM74387.1 DUF4230 domain-containing protein [Sphingomonas sp. AAP5]